MTLHTLAFSSDFRLKHVGGQGMELYSTVLWHTKREVDLSHLACTSLDQADRNAG